MENKTIYDLNMHEEIEKEPELYVRRVPGGWIYTDTGFADDQSVFVPYNEEFKESK